MKDVINQRKDDILLCPCEVFLDYCADNDNANVDVINKLQIDSMLS